MRVALFPDTRSVVVLTAPGEHSSPGEHSPRGAALHRLPREEELRDLAISLPPAAWRVSDHRGEQMTGVLLDSAAVEPLLQEGAGTPAGLIPAVISRRTAADTMDILECSQMNRTYHLTAWNGNTRFCGACAAPMEWSTVETAKVCTTCGMVQYPRINPAVIMAVVREGKLLMARAHRHPEGMFSVLAGFVEAGENLELAVSREVHEECGLLLRNITYFSSQPWPFPDSLMIAFTAEHAGGEIVLEESEIAEAGWFGPGEIPPRIPDTYSVARRLIEWFVSEYGTEAQLRKLLTR